MASPAAYGSEVSQNFNIDRPLEGTHKFVRFTIKFTREGHKGNCMKKLLYAQQF